MKVIEKLNIVSKIALLFLIFPFVLVNLKEFNYSTLMFIILFLVVLSRLIFFKGKNINYRHLPAYYAIGIIFIFSAVFASIGTIEDWEHIRSIPLFGIIALIGLWTFGILITYYTYKAIKESPLRKSNKKKNLY